MTINPRLNYPAYDTGTPRPQPLFWKPYRRRLDFALFLLAVLAVIVLAINDFAMISTLMLSIILIPIVVPMLFAVPVAAALVPFRIFYGILRQRFNIRMSIAISIPMAALSMNAMDSALKYGPDGRAAAQEIVAHETALRPVAVPDHGIIGFRYDGPRWQWTDCPDLCKTLLNDGIATRVMNYGRDGTPFQAFYLADGNGGCLGEDKPISRSALICEQRNPTERTELRFDLVYEDLGDATPGLNAIYHVTVHSGALVQHTKMVSAEVAKGGGILAPYMSDNQGDGYFPDTDTIRIVPDSMADLYATGAWDRSMFSGFDALVLSLLR